MKYRKTMLAFVFILSMYVKPALAQTDRRISLKEAVELGVKNSSQIKYNQAAITQATAAIREAEERRLPDFSVSASYLHLNNPDIDMKAKSSSGGTGTPSAAPPKVSQAAYSLVNASLPVFAGGRIKYGIASSRLLAEAVKFDADQDKQEVIMNIMDAYSNLYKAATSVELVREHLKQAQQRVTDFTSLEKNGLLARNDLLRAQYEVSNLELALMDAENNVKIANTTLNLLTGLPGTTHLVTDSSGFTLTVDNRPLTEWESLALKNRKDLNAFSFRKKSAEFGIKSIEAEKLPSVALTGGYIAAHVPNLLTVTNAVNIGVGIQYSLSSLWKTNSKAEQARSSLQQLEARETMATDQVRLQINSAYQQFLLTNKKIDVLDKAVQQADENYRITKNKYQNSLATTTELLDADVAMLQSRLNFELAKVDASISYNKLLQTAGLLQ